MSKGCATLWFQANFISYLFEIAVIISEKTMRHKNGKMKKVKNIVQLRGAIV
jgi:hypothetical protein